MNNNQSSPNNDSQSIQTDDESAELQQIITWLKQGFTQSDPYIATEKRLQKIRNLQQSIDDLNSFDPWSSKAIELIKKEVLKIIMNNNKVMNYYSEMENADDERSTVRIFCKEHNINLSVVSNLKQFFANLREIDDIADDILSIFREIMDYVEEEDKLGKLKLAHHRSRLLTYTQMLKTCQTKVEPKELIERKNDDDNNNKSVNFDVLVMGDMANGRYIYADLWRSTIMLCGLPFFMCACPTGAIYNPIVNKNRDHVRKMTINYLNKATSLHNGIVNIIEIGYGGGLETLLFLLTLQQFTNYKGINLHLVEPRDTGVKDGLRQYLSLINESNHTSMTLSYYKDAKDIEKINYYQHPTLIYTFDCDSTDALGDLMSVVVNSYCRIETDVKVVAPLTCSISSAGNFLIFQLNEINNQQKAGSSLLKHHELLNGGGIVADAMVKSTTQSNCFVQKLNCLSEKRGERLIIGFFRQIDINHDKIIPQGISTTVQQFCYQTPTL